MLYDFGALQKDIRQWEDKAGRPAAVIGRSVCGRPLYGLWMGNGQETAVILAGFHGMEWITSAVLMDYAHHCQRVPPPVRLLMVPMVNPDGVEISLHGAQTAGPYAPQVRKISPDPTCWQANARGVDLNHNFPAGWETLRKMEIRAGILGPSPTRYGGEGSGSEPETQAVMQAIIHADCHRVLALHSQGEEIYDDVGIGMQPPGTRERAQKMAKSSGYALKSQPAGLASLGGCKDWVQMALHKQAFTVEMGKGKNPLAFTQKEEIETHMFPLFADFLQPELVAPKGKL